MRFLWFLLLLASAYSSRVISAENPRIQPVASSNAVQQLKAWLARPAGERSAFTNQSFVSVPLTRADCASAAAALWQDHQKYILETRADEMRNQLLELDGLKIKFQTLLFTNGPASNGHSLFLSLHGGGGAPAQVNESQWRNQIKLGNGYRPTEGIYLAPRAPTDDWNLWHQEHIDRFFDRLIQNLIVLSNVNPNRVYVMGYSAGGDGVYQLAPRMADRFAAAAMMAGHPNDASPLGLRNLPFAIQVGANDDGYRRNSVAAEWGAKLDKLQQADPGGYVHFLELHEGKGHWMDLQDRKAVPWMEKFNRVALPEKVVWRQSTVTHTRFYWVAVPAEQAKAGQEIVAQRSGQTVTLSTSDAHAVIVLLNDAMLDLDKPVTVRTGEKNVFEAIVPRTIGTLARTLSERGDTNLTFSTEIRVKLP